MNTLCFLILAFLIGSNLNGQQISRVSPKIFTVDFTTKYPEKKIRLQDIADMRYIPLETNSDVLLDKDASIDYVSDNCYVISNKKNGDVFVFNSDGKIKAHFNKRGKGPMEYIQIRRLVFDEKNGEILITFYSSPQKFLVYAMDGTYKRTLYLSQDTDFTDVYNFDDKTLLAYDTKDINMPQARETANKQPYYLISKKDGKIVSQLKLKFKDRISNVLVITENAQMRSRTLSAENNLKFGQKFVITDMSSDTVYHLMPDGTFVPMLVKKPSVRNAEPPAVMVTGLETDKFISMANLLLDFNRDRNSRRSLISEVMLEYESGEIYNPFIFNADIPSYKFDVAINKMELPRNMCANFYRVENLQKALEDNKLKGELKELTMKLKEEDNPVLVLVKFK